MTVRHLPFWWKQSTDFGTVEQVPGLASWAASVQAAVTAIRKAGATTQMILLPGTSPPPSSFHPTHLTHDQATAIPAPAHSSQAARPPSLPASPTSTAARTTSSSTCTNTSTRTTPAPRPPAPPTALVVLSNHSSIGSKIRIARPCSLRREVAAIARAV